MTVPADPREALARIAGWSAHWKDDSRSSLRLSMQLIHEEAIRAHPSALAARQDEPSPAPIHQLGALDTDRPDDELRAEFYAYIDTDEDTATPVLTTYGNLRAIRRIVASAFMKRCRGECGCGIEDSHYCDHATDGDA